MVHCFDNICPSLLEFGGIGAVAPPSLFLGGTGEDDSVTYLELRFNLRHLSTGKHVLLQTCA